MEHGFKLPGPSYVVCNHRQLRGIENDNKRYNETDSLKMEDQRYDRNIAFKSVRIGADKNRTLGGASVLWK